jgi:hypothetical protein
VVEFVTFTKFGGGHTAATPPGLVSVPVEALVVVPLPLVVRSMPPFPAAPVMLLLPGIGVGPPQATNPATATAAVP